MKYRVIGWTKYDCPNFEEGEISWSATNAVIDEIKKNKYLFSGRDHQDKWGCVPVLNDGKSRCFSLRGFAQVMAEAYGHTESKSYALFMYMLNPDAVNIPKDILYNTDELDIETDLNETFTMRVNKRLFSKAQKTNSIIFKDINELRYIDIGDTLELVNGDVKSTYLIEYVDRHPDAPKEKREKLVINAIMGGDNKTTRKATKKLDSLPIVIDLKLKNIS